MANRSKRKRRGHVVAAVVDGEVKGAIVNIGGDAEPAILAPHARKAGQVSALRGQALVADLMTERCPSFGVKVHAGVILVDRYRPGKTVCEGCGQLTDLAEMNGCPNLIPSGVVMAMLLPPDVLHSEAVVEEAAGLIVPGSA